MSDLPKYELIRNFDAPRELVWRCWTEPDLLARWYGPNIETIVHKLDVRPGGLWLNEMRMEHGSGFQRTEFLEVDEPDRLVCIMSSSDADWNVVAQAGMPDWPRNLLTTVTFTETAGKTEMRLTWVPHDATEAEIAFFGNALAGADGGWKAGMELLETMLADMQR